MTDALTLLRKVERVREFLGRARSRRSSDLDELMHDLERQDALAMAILVATQEAADIAFHMAADAGWGVPTTTRGAFEAAARNGVITSAEASALGEVAGLRNRIAHGYASVDFGRLWTELPETIDRLERWVDAVSRWVASQSV